MSNSKYSFSVVPSSITNGVIVSQTSTSITIRWQPTNWQQFVQKLYAEGSLTFSVTNNCPGGQTNNHDLIVFMYGGDGGL